MRTLILAFLAVAVSFGPAYAVSDLSGSFTSDNHYNFYVSTDDSVAGTLIGSSNPSADSSYPYDWGTPESWNISLTPGVTNYLHIYAWDDAGPGGVIGSFSLNSPNFRFDNGTQSVFTTTQDNWLVRDGGWNGTDITSSLVDEGGIGSSPWGNPNGNFNVFDPNSKWIWTNYVSSSPYNDPQAERYFSVKVNTVPEPVSTILFLTGGTILLVRRLRRKK